MATAQDTFSIVAIDSLTGETGSAGASCVRSSSTYPHGAAILSDVIPGVGVIHSQAAWNPVNQQNAHDWMIMEKTVSDRILWLKLKGSANPQVLGFRLITGKQKVIVSGKFQGYYR